MRKLLFTLIFVILLTSLVSADIPEADIVITNQPDQVYNLGDTIKIPISISSSTDITLIKSYLSLICGGKKIEIWEEENFCNDVGSLKAGEGEKRICELPLVKETIGFTKGTCKIKATLKTPSNEEYIDTTEFKISDILTVTLKSGEGEFKPEDEIIVEGEVTKENGKTVNGFVELELSTGNASQKNYVETVNNGFFTVNLELPAETAAGPYLISLKAYEKDNSGEITNKGFLDYTITILQVPTSLEVVFENQEIEPGTNLKAKAVLHDQTGVNIDTTAIITIKDKNDKILEQQQKATNEFLEFLVKYNEPPANWTVFAVSNQLNGEAECTIKEKKEVKYELANQTLKITNVGNVLYNDTLFIKIGEEMLNIPTILKVDESKKYTLNAPDGEYDIEIVKEDGSETIGRVSLTGKTIEIKEAKQIMEKIFNPFIWIFVVVICGFAAFIFFKKGYKKNFVGYIKTKKDFWKSKKKDKRPESKSEKTKSLNIKGNAILSLSIKGDKQNAGVVCLKIKNFGEIEAKKNGVQEKINKIINLAENKKAVLYENGEYLFFILAPAITKTFKNEKTVVVLAKQIKNELIEYNRLARQKIEFGISVNYGEIVAKKEGGILKFMSLKTFIPKAKKIATISDQEIFLSDEIGDRLRNVGGIRTEKIKKDNITVYVIKQIRDTKGDSQFLGSFLKRLEKEEKKED